MVSATKSLTIFYERLRRALFSVSRLSQRFIGPIIIEGIIILIPAGALVIARLLLRSISYASLQRVMATSIAIAVFILVYFLRL